MSSKSVSRVVISATLNPQSASAARISPPRTRLGAYWITSLPGAPGCTWKRDSSDGGTAATGSRNVTVIVFESIRRSSASVVSQAMMRP